MIPMRSAALCYAPEDAALAHEIACFLELNCAVAVSDKDGLIGPDFDLIDAAERALSADYLLILLSPDSVPNTWLRTRWERILVDGARHFDTAVAYILLRRCKFPEVFRRKTFFDLCEHRLAGQRALKRCLLRQGPFFQTSVDLPNRPASLTVPASILEDLVCRLADQPGVKVDVPSESALEFAHITADDFEGSFFLSCANRSRAGILGDMAHLLHLRLRGTLEQNARALHEFCANRRLLFVFEHIAPSDRELVSFGGKSSVIFVLEQAKPPHRSLTEAAAIFSGWTNSIGACLRALGDAQYHLGQLREYCDEDRRTVISIGSSASSCLKHSARLAESCELLECMIDHLRAMGDRWTAAQLEWERSWMLEEWGMPVAMLDRPIAEGRPTQLSLGFE